MSPISSTYKARETEETLDIFFYRPLGYLIAVAARAVRLTPNGLTLASLVFGVVAAALFGSLSLSINAVGMVLLVVSEAFDAADGQLARMTQRFSRFGRIMDGLATNLIYAVLYCVLCARLAPEISLWGALALIVVAGGSHSIQSAAADFYRNGFVHFVLGAARAELDSAERVAADYRAASWRRQFWPKLLLRLYLNYTREQSTLTRSFRRLMERAQTLFGDDYPGWLRDEYRRLNGPLIKYYNTLTSNTRMIALFVALLLRRPLLFPLFEIVALNALLVHTLGRQERNNMRLVARLDEGAPEVA